MLKRLLFLLLILPALLAGKAQRPNIVFMFTDVTRLCRSLPTARKSTKLPIWTELLVGDALTTVWSPTPSVV